MSDEVRDANLALLIGLQRHLDEAERLRTLLDRLLSLAARNTRPSNNRTSKIAGKNRKGTDDER